MKKQLTTIFGHIVLCDSYIEPNFLRANNIKNWTQYNIDPPVSNLILLFSLSTFFLGKGREMQCAYYGEWEWRLGRREAQR